MGKYNFGTGRINRSCLQKSTLTPGDVLRGPTQSLIKNQLEKCKMINFRRKKSTYVLCATFMLSLMKADAK